MSTAYLPAVTIIGSLNIDFTTYTPRTPTPGETLTGTSFTIDGGGKGANQAVACGRASLTTAPTPSSPPSHSVRVSMVGAIGKNDTNYESHLKRIFDASGVDATGVREIGDTTTGVATIIVDGAGQNSIIVVPGANWDGMRDVDLLLQQLEEKGRPEVVVMQGEIPRDTTVQLLERLNKTQTAVVFNPAPVFTEGIPLESLKDLAVLVVNETEAIQLAGLTGYNVTGLSEDNFPVEKLAGWFHEVCGVKVALLTLGAKGVFFSTKTGKQGRIEGVKVPKVVDTTAAGDTFVGYFSCALARFLGAAKKIDEFDEAIEEAVKKANAAAAVCVQHKGAMESVPFAYDLE